MVFSTNQFRHLYVAKADKSASKVDTLGDIAAKVDATGKVYFQYQGHGGIVRSDLIDPETVMYARATKASEMARELKAITELQTRQLTAESLLQVKIIS